MDVSSFYWYLRCTAGFVWCVRCNGKLVGQVRCVRWNGNAWGILTYSRNTFHWNLSDSFLKTLEPGIYFTNFSLLLLHQFLHNLQQIHPTWLSWTRDPKHFTIQEWNKRKSSITFLEFFIEPNFVCTCTNKAQGLTIAIVRDDKDR